MGTDLRTYVQDVLRLDDLFKVTIKDYFFLLLINGIYPRQAAHER